MREQVGTENSELDRNNGIDHALAGFSSLRINDSRISVTNVKSRANSYTDEESDTSSDYGNSSRGSSRKGSQDSEDLHDFKKPIFQQTISVESDDASGVSSVDSKACKTNYQKVDCSDNLLSEIESDSDDESSDDEDESEEEDLIQKLNELRVTVGEHTRSHRDETDSEDEDTVRARGPSNATSNNHNVKSRGKPYDRKIEEQISFIPSNVDPIQCSDDVGEQVQLTPWEMEIIAAALKNNPDFIANQYNDKITGDPANVVNPENAPFNNPIISVVDTDETSTPLTNMPTYNLTRQPLSSASSSNTSDFNDRSPQSYVGEYDSVTDDYFAREFEPLLNCNISSSAENPLMTHGESNDMNIFPTENFHLPPTNNVSYNFANYDLQSEIDSIQNCDQSLWPVTPNLLDSLSPDIGGVPNNFASSQNTQFNIPFTQGNLSIDQNLGYSVPGRQTEVQFDQLNPRMTTMLPNVTNYSQTMNNSLQNQTTPTNTFVQNIVTTTRCSAKGTLTVNAGYNSETINGDPRSIIKFSNYDWSPSSNGSSKNSCVLNVQKIPSPPSTSARPVDIPESVENFDKKSKSPERKLKDLKRWRFMGLQSESAIRRLQQKISAHQAKQGMKNCFTWTAKKLAEVDSMGHTKLMTFVSNPGEVGKSLHELGPMLAKMNRDSLITEDERRHDALYLAAINCPQHEIVSGVLADCIMQAHGDQSPFWKKTYNTCGDTLLHVVATQGDTHADVMRELLSVKTPENRCPFDLSATNSDGKTPLHLAVESYDKINNHETINIIRLLVDHGTDRTIRENRNGDTALHVAISRRCSKGIIQTLLHNDDGRTTNVCNYAGNTPLHLACSELNNSHNQEEICYRLIVQSAKSNIRNHRNQTPLMLVSDNRKENVRKIFQK